ncbi:MAG: thioredoxin [Thermodesulfobacteriota bacterium]|nr:thioredoxin [Thermodesulfobacteriota bacterium]
MTKDINDDSFEQEVINSEKPVMVDFWAPWCGPCKAIGPIVQDLEKTYGDKIKFVKVNVDEEPVSPSKYSIQAIPTIIFFKDGTVADQVVGMVGKDKLEQSIKALV